MSDPTDKYRPEYDTGYVNAGRPALGELARAFLHVGCLGFGGPAAQIALMHRLVVEERRWLSEERFLRALNYCMLLPGPEAQQLATYVGWLSHGVRGGLVCGLLFVLPGLALILALSAAYAFYNQLALVDGLFLGLKAAVVALVVQALWRIAGRTLKDGFRIAVALLAFLAIFMLAMPFPLVVALAAMLGLGRALLQRRPQALAEAPAAGPRVFSSIGRALRDTGIWVAVWQAPYVLMLAIGATNLAAIFAFFSRLAVVTFGGAYAIMAYVAQVAVEKHGWLDAGAMLDGLALAEATPGPLVLVLSFIGFMAGARGEDAAGALSLAGGLAGGLGAAWATFVPSFLFIFAGAPLIERLAGNRLVDAALSAVTAAVVGVILNLTVWFALHFFFGTVTTVELATFAGRALKLPLPAIASLDPAAVCLAVLAALLLFAARLGMGVSLAVTAAAGLAWRLLA